MSLACSQAQAGESGQAASEAAAKHTLDAASTTSQASGQSANASISAGASVAAVPVWMAGNLAKPIVAGSEQAESQMWDATTGDPAQRPSLDLNLVKPVTPPDATPPKRDLPPSEAMQN